MGNKIDISSTAIEKGIDLAKNFLDKLIIPAVEETGLLLKDKVTLWKFKNQVKMLNKAKSYCEKYNVNPKTISLKLLCPLLDYSSLEEDEELQDKWAILLTNMVDSEQNIENHVFPYILSQISSNEFAFLEDVFDYKIVRQTKLKEELKLFLESKPAILENIQKEVLKLDEKITKIKEKSENKGWNPETWELERSKDKLKNDIKVLDRKENVFNYRINESQTIPEEELKEFEISNLIRLGLIRFVQIPYAHPQTLEIPYENDSYYGSGSTQYTNVDVEIEIESDEEYVLTELGEMFINVCKIKE
ncbi:Abi-alpha family protein [uncultured Psychroserpens sp.]|uniref:Abi-alpha family protein n=1 Tax=uncultured Psychroserpens sp. TaxID=255436 RepID=UPI002603E5C9|nr:Abi-alpha family protein [uncultured Psychroserpens sp.]